MPFSQNGYSANNESLLTTIEIPGGRLRVRKGPVAVIFKYLAEQFNATVEPIKGPVLDDWSYASRPIRGGETLSNHASGTAIDLNALQHPLGRVGTFTTKQRHAINTILSFLDGAVRWGGNYSGRKDEMHFEINAGAATVTRVANRITALNKPTITEDEMTPDDWKKMEALIDKKIAAVPQKVWSYTNPALENVDVYRVVRSTRDAVKGQPPAKKVG